MNSHSATWPSLLLKLANYSSQETALHAQYVVEKIIGKPAGNRCFWQREALEYKSVDALSNGFDLK